MLDISGIRRLQFDVLIIGAGGAKHLGSRASGNLIMK